MINNLSLSPGRPVFSSLLFVLIAGLLVKVFFVQTQTPDDVGMTMISSGCGLLDAGNAHILFSNIIIGKLLVALYKANNSFPWYGAYLFVVDLVGLWAITLELLTQKPHAQTWFLLVLFFFSVALHPLCMLHFSSTACMIGLGGFALLLGWSEDKKEGRTLSYAKPVLSTMMYLICSLIRYQSFQLISILSLATFVIRDFDGFNRRAFTISKSKPYLILAATFCLAFCLQAYNQRCYSDSKGWEEFYEANYLIANFVDFGYGRTLTPERLLELRSETGWTVNDLLMLQNFFCLDDARFSILNMQKAKQLLVNTHYTSPSAYLTDFSEVVTNPIMHPILVILLLGACACGNKRFQKQRVFALLLFSLVLMLALLYFLKLPEWVYVPIFSFLCFVIFFYVSRQRNVVGVVFSVRRKFIVAGIAGSMVFVLAANTFQNYWVRGRAIRDGNRMLKNAFVTLKPNDKNLYTVWSDNFPFGYVLPFDDLTELFRQFRFLNFAFRGNGYVASNTMEKYGISLVDFDEAITRKDVYLVSNSNLNALMVKYLREHYHISATAVLRNDFYPLKLQFYQIFKSE